MSTSKSQLYACQGLPAPVAEKGSTCGTAWCCRIDSPVRRCHQTSGSEGPTEWTAIQVGTANRRVTTTAWAISSPLRVGVAGAETSRSPVSGVSGVWSCPSGGEPSTAWEATLPRYRCPGPGLNNTNGYQAFPFTEPRASPPLG